MTAKAPVGQAYSAWWEKKFTTAQVFQTFGPQVPESSKRAFQAAPRV